MLQVPSSDPGPVPAKLNICGVKQQTSICTHIYIFVAYIYACHIYVPFPIQLHDKEPGKSVDNGASPPALPPM